MDNKFLQLATIEARDGKLSKDNQAALGQELLLSSGTTKNSYDALVDVVRRR